MDFGNSTLTIIGSTGSIGMQALDIAKHLGIKIVGISANTSIDILKKQIAEYKPQFVAVADETCAAKLKNEMRFSDVKILSGQKGVCELATVPVDNVLTSVVGIAGLMPTASAIKAKNNICLANKETLVAAGDYIMPLSREYDVSVLPVDSEHSAIFQSIGCNSSNCVKKIILTASGGPFFGFDSKQLSDVTLEQTLKHPNWVMGQKITTDCATMMNKGFEEIEAVHLFNVDINNIEVLVHRQSIVHSMVEFDDNSVVAQMAQPDMRIPIQYALTYPERVKSPVGSLDFTEVASLTFHKPDRKVFKCLALCEEAARRGGLYPAAVNAADEVAVKMFLNKKIKFCQIADIVESVFDLNIPTSYQSLDDVLELDKYVRSSIEQKY